ncbi:MAG: hypothetical protein ABIO02_01210 [Patescibacteria group bacterium]
MPFQERITPDLKEFVNNPYQCTVGMGNHSVDIFSNSSEFIFGFENGALDYLDSFPGWNLQFKTPSSPHKIYFNESTDDNGLHYSPENKTLFMHGAKEHFLSGQVLAYSGFWLMEEQRQRDSQFTMHSSAVARNDRGLIMIGDEGAGKTSLMMKLAYDHGFSVASNDLTVLGYDASSQQAHIMDGTTKIRLRLASVQRNFPQLTNCFNPGSSESVWDQKVVVKPEDIGLRRLHTAVPLATAFSIYLDSDPSRNLNIERADDIHIRYKLYEDMSRIIRGSAISLFTNHSRILGYLPSLDNEEIHNSRINFIEGLINNVGIWKISGGNIDELAQEINRIFEGSN